MNDYYLDLLFLQQEHLQLSFPYHHSITLATHFLAQSNTSLQSIL